VNKQVSESQVTQDIEGGELAPEPGPPALPLASGTGACLHESECHRELRGCGLLFQNSLPSEISPVQLQVLTPA
jgi:hypothetical protein